MSLASPRVVGPAGYAAICIWTGVLFVNRNPEVAHLLQASIMGAALPACCLAVCAAGLLAAIAAERCFGLPHGARSLCLLTALVFIAFSHQAFHYWVHRLLSLRALAGEFLYVLTAAALLLTVWKASRHEAVRFAIAVFAIVMLTLAVGNWWGTHGPGVQQPWISERPSEPDGTARTFSGENVYYVILDGYGGPATLKSSGGIDIEPFLSSMAAWGFESLRSSRSNYIVTHASLAATLEMSYVIDEQTPRYRSRRDFFPESLSRAQPPEVVRRSRAAGYSFLHIGNAWAPCRWRTSVSCADDRHPTAKQATEVIERYLAPTRVLDLVAHVGKRAAPADDDALSTLTQLIRAGAHRRGPPTFFFVHHLVPHDPLNADCTRSDQPMSKALYANGIRCVNGDALKLTELIRREDPKAVLVFQADHGSDFLVDWQLPLAQWNRASIDERSSILNLIRLPSDCRPWLKPDLSPINTMRLVMACLERREPAYVDERTYLTTYETARDFGLVRRAPP